MQMSEAAEVVQVAGADNANKRLADGWKLLAVVPSANNEGKVHVAYVLGKPAEKSKTDWKKMSE
ncbi:MULTISPECIES: hypothetical protein [unclassified Pseudomonas]|uniref:hypothetical protein n=1 Tax=unclassified Pseudomonas TaxID=196821 RepID=UPI001649045F|nr:MULTISPECIES: hypothetical protein [unclassified Pseudomonas]MBC3774703.1 hypothetical protein [Pseudomonas sp. SWRI99]QXZ14025.1 hypothetical protein KVQ82_28850 [Pseudomonas sp. AO-1]